MKPIRSTGNARLWRVILQLLMTIVLALLGRKKAGSQSPEATPSSRKTPRQPVSKSGANKRASSKSSATVEDTIAKLFAARQSDQIVTSSGLIVKILPDDLHDDDGSGKHQQFLVEVGNVTIKIAHNMKFGEVPVEEGETVHFKGEYEWNDRGGCIHWTHQDPKGWHEDGWIEYQGKRYG